MPGFRVPPEDVLAILRSAAATPCHPELPQVLRVFELDWLAIARRRYPKMLGDFEDVAQVAALRLVSPTCLARLTSASKLVPWARSIFVNAMLDAIRDTRIERSLRLDIQGDEDGASADVIGERFPFRGPGTEELCSYRERLAIIDRLMADLEVARLKFREGLSDKEIAARCDLTRDAVAGLLKRFRQSARKAVGDLEPS